MNINFINLNLLLLLESLEQREHQNLIVNYIFDPFGVETLDWWSPIARAIFKQLVKELIEAFRDQKAGLFLAERISIAIQRDNFGSSTSRV